MLPRSTNTRIDREAAKGKQKWKNSRNTKINWEKFRSVTNLENLGERQIKLIVMFCRLMVVPEQLQ